ncbi:MAG: proton-conducting transporter membrane subunit, partial [Gemmatimonadales bacterium]
THAFFKALLFLGSGSVIHAMHHAYHHTHREGADAQDMRNMGGLREYLPVTAATMWIATLAIAGIPPLAGFFSKDEILTAAFARGHGDPVWYVIWFMCAAGALLTAFYMTRLMRYTFHGPNRTGDQERAHLHESPRVMTWPLLALAGLTHLGGLINLPAFLPGGGWLERWLEPVTRTGTYLAAGESHLSSGTEGALIALAVLIAAFGIWLAWTRLDPAALVTPERSSAETGFAKLLAEKYRVDEIYEKFIVGPLLWASRVVLWKGVDAGLIDGAGVNGSAVFARTVGWLGTRLQTGRVGTYVVLFVVGVLAILGALVR